MKKIIEYKLWNGQIPYFVEAPLGGVYNGGKRYGVSRDTAESYLPDTVSVLSAEELAVIVQANNLFKTGDNPMETVPMDAADKTEYMNAWLAKHGLGELPES